MNGPLLISLLPPERIAGSVSTFSEATQIIAVLLFAGLLLSLLLRRPEH